ALDAPVEAVSFHNPVAVPLPGFEDESVCGMVSAVSTRLVERYTYGSDSNGYWRHRSLFEVVADPEVTRLHALTHPEWWQPTPMAPRERVARCVQGRARAMETGYDDTLTAFGRTNVRDASDLGSE